MLNGVAVLKSGTILDLTSVCYLPEDQFDDVYEKDQYKLKGGILLVKKQKPRIIRSVRFNKNKDHKEIMLNTSRRNEDKDLIQHFETVKNVIEYNSKPYENNSEILHQVIENVENKECSNVQHRDEQDCETGSKASKLYGCFDPGKNKQHAEYHLMDDIDIFPRTNDNEELVVKQMNDNEFGKLVQSFNIKQKEFFCYISHSISYQILSQQNDHGDL